MSRLALRLGSISNEQDNDFDNLYRLTFHSENISPNIWKKLRTTSRLFLNANMNANREKSVNISYISQQHSSNPEIKSSSLNIFGDNILFLYEMIGMFIFIYGQVCTNQNIGIHLQITILLAIVINICAPFSGANFNPSVTLAFCLCKFNRYKISILWLYFKTQVFTSFIALTVGYWLNSGLISQPLVATSQVTNTQILFSEMIGTFLLIFFILHLSNQQTSPTKDSPVITNLFIIPLVYMARKSASLSYCCINPAIVLSHGFMHLFVNLDLQPLYAFSYFFIGELVGTLLAVVFYNNFVYQIKRSLLKQNSQKFQFELERFTP